MIIVRRRQSCNLLLIGREFFAPHRMSANTLLGLGTPSAAEQPPFHGQGAGYESADRLGPQDESSPSCQSSDDVVGQVVHPRHGQANGPGPPMIHILNAAGEGPRVRQIADVGDPRPQFSGRVGAPRSRIFVVANPGHRGYLSPGSPGTPVLRTSHCPRDEPMTEWAFSSGLPRTSHNSSSEVWPVCGVRPPSRDRYVFSPHPDKTPTDVAVAVLSNPIVPGETPGSMPSALPDSQPIVCVFTTARLPPRPPLRDGLDS